MSRAVRRRCCLRWDLTQASDFQDVLGRENDLSLAPACMRKAPGGSAVAEPGLSASHEGSCLGRLEELKVHLSSLISWVVLAVHAPETQEWT